MSAIGVGKKRGTPRKRMQIVRVTVDGVEVDAKECTKCGKVRVLRDYHIGRSVGGRNSICKECTSYYLTKKRSGREVPSFRFIKSEVSYKTVNGTDVEGKLCNKCITWKPLEGYGFRSIHLGKLSAVCMECEKRRYSERRLCENYKNTQSRYYTKHKSEILKKGRVWRENNKERMEICRDRWKRNNPYNRNLVNQRRRARVRGLPSQGQAAALGGNCNECTLTGFSNVDLDHFIAISTGHGGSYTANLIKLSAVINKSKSSNNPFNWFEANRQRFEIDESRWNALVTYLAEQNGITPAEFRSYVDWCYANPRTIDEIQADNERYGYVVSSLELWRDAVGLPFPIRLDLPKVHTEKVAAA